MGSYRVTQRLVMQCEGDLDEQKAMIKLAHEHALNRQVIEGHRECFVKWARRRGEIGRPMSDHDNDAGPLQNIT